MSPTKTRDLAASIRLSYEPSELTLKIVGPLIHFSVDFVGFVRFCGLMNPIADKKTDIARWEHLKAELRVRGYTMRGLAREIGCAPNTPSKVRRRHYPRMEREIAARLGMTPESIWPERYTNAPRPICQKAGGAR